MSVKIARILLLAACAASASLAQLPNPFPIPQQSNARPVPGFLGSPATAQPVTAPAIPQNPYMGPNPWNNIHNDTYMSDTYPVTAAGPLGHSPKVLSTFLGSATVPAAPVVVIVFDQAGRLIAGSIATNLEAGTAQVSLVLIDPNTLATLAKLALPPETATFKGEFRPSGAYFYLDQSGRILVGTVERTVWVVSHTASSFSHDQTYDLSSAIPEGDTIQALQPDFSGRIWFTSKGGVVGTLDPASGSILGSMQLTGENIDNSSASDETGGVFIASNQAMYRFDADSAGKPAVTWREPYDAGKHIKSGQVDVGTGTTPTVMGSGYVTITDNAEPNMHVLVYHRAKTVTGNRLFCSVPVFQPGANSTENSLVATDSSIVVENNFGYKSVKSTEHGKTSKTGLARIDLDPQGCHTVWTNTSESIPTLVTKLALSNGLIYTYTKPKGPANTDAWYFTAIDFATGQTVYSQLAGTGTLFNNHYAGLFLGPNGSLYVGVLGGVVSMADTQ
jgi:hypothetical protein